MMKKVIAAVISLCFVFMMAMPVFAASVSKADIINEVKKGVTVAGKTITAPDEYVKVLSDFLNANELSAQELEYAMTQYNEAKAIIVESGVTSFSQMSTELKTQLIEKATAAAKTVGATLTFDGKVIKVVDKNGKVFSVGAPGASPIKPTGLNVDPSALIVVSAVLMAGLGVSVFAIRKYRLTEEK